MTTRREFIKQALLAGSSLPLLLAACERSGYQNIDPEARAIVLGIDGLDPVLMKQMMSAGDLPHFARLARTGVFSPLATSNPPQSPVAWSSLATGHNPGRHGLFDFLTRDPDTYLPELGILSHRGGLLPGSSFSNPRHSPAMWEILSAAGIPSTVLRWPVTFPPADISGKILAGLGVPDIKGELGNYTFYSSRRPEPDGPGRDKVKTISFRDDTAETVIPGPLVKGARDTAPAVVPLKIKRTPPAGEIELEIQGRACRLAENQWSPWIRLNFRINAFSSITGIGRFFLKSVARPFELYLSPVQIDPANPCYAISHPESYATELQNKFGDFHTLGIPEDTKALTENRLDDDTFLDMCDTIMTEQEVMFRHELENFQQGLLANVFYTTDRIQHIYWATLDPGHPAYSPSRTEKYGTVIKQYYQRLDRILADVMEKIDSRTLLMVCSDHGFSSFKYAVHLNSWLAANGFMTLRTQPDRDDRDGGPLFQHVDWKRTTAYAVGLNGIFLNLKGREKSGLIEPARREVVLEELIARLKQWENPATGEKVILSACPASKLYHGPRTSRAPDLIIGFNRGCRVSWQSALGGTPRRLLEPNTDKWTGDHCLDPSLVPGVLFSNRKLNTRNCDLLDIAPTILHHFGLKPDMDGDSLTG
ncbi:MAG: alkaline phosphatase family protein [Desulfosudaceae bacterium]